MPAKYFGFAQLCGSIIDSVKANCSPCFPVNWCGVGIDATTDGLRDGRYDPWLQRETPHLDRYEQKPPPVGDIKFHEKDLEATIDESLQANDMGLNSYGDTPSTGMPSSASTTTMCRMRFGVKRGLKKVSSKMQIGKKKHRCGVKKAHDDFTIINSAYPTQELAMKENGFLYPLQEETETGASVDDTS